jgi:hypothetical protein
MQLTIWDTKVAKVLTIHGVKNYLDWCQELIVKMKRRKGLDCFIQSKKAEYGNLIAVFENTKKVKWNYDYERPKGGKVDVTV